MSENWEANVLLIFFYPGESFKGRSGLGAVERVFWG